VDPEAIKIKIRAMAKELGFGQVGFARPNSIPEASKHLQNFLELNHHGEMQWMVNDRRFSPEKIWSDANTAIMLGMNYGPDHDPMENLLERDKGNISVYARGDDYHDVVKKKLKAMARYILTIADPASHPDVKVFVDTAPLMEKPLAQSAGLGWQGKHTNLVSQEYGSWLFLGSVFTTLHLPPDKTDETHCGSCRACLDVCPTQAFPEPYKLDARKCISYLTIEYSGVIDFNLREKLGNRIYGCDDCLAVCPWNKYAKSGQEIKLSARAENDLPDLLDLISLNDPDFRARFSKSPIKRIGRDRFIRNLLIAVGNLGLTATDAHRAAVELLLSDDNAVVRASAVWALRSIAPDRAESLRTKQVEAEIDDGVMCEWNRELADNTAKLT
jgi:epoxyqueuosine reductase